MSDFASGFLGQGEWAVLGYLANAVWQVPLVFVAAWITARLARRAGAGAEHRVWVMALLLEVGLPAGHMDLGAAWAWVVGLIPGHAAAHEGAVGVVVGAGAVNATGGLKLPAEVLAGLAAAFVVALIYSAARLGWGVWRTEAMRRQALPVVLEGDAARAWLRCGGEARGGLARAAEVRVSGMVCGPVTVGILRPAVLVPPGFLEGLEARDLEAVLAHELTHVRRWDFAKNLFYEAISVAAAWHPVVWMTRARVAESREMVCDEAAAGAVSGKERYARSLLRLASMVADGRPGKTLHAIGIFDANSFERRVMNLTKSRVEMRMAQRVVIAGACAVMVLGTCTTAMALRVEVGPQVEAVAVGAGAQPLKVKPGQLKQTDKKVPIYPVEAKEKKNTINGSVELAVTIGKDGSVKSLKLKKSLRKDYDESAWAAVKDWKWEPFLLNGEPTEVETTVTVTYSLSTDEAKEEPKTQAALEDASGAWDIAPKILERVDTMYPSQARSSNDTLNGAVVVGLTVGSNGVAREMHVVHSLRADYDESALTAVRQYRFSPAIADGRPVDAKIQVQVDFRLY